jgi:hypothetical protein
VGGGPGGNPNHPGRGQHGRGDKRSKGKHGGNTGRGDEERQAPEGGNSQGRGAAGGTGRGRN